MLKYGRDQNCKVHNQIKTQKSVALPLKDNIIQMEFTQIQEISSFLNHSYTIASLQKDVFGSDPWVVKVFSQQILYEPQFHQAMKNLDKLNQEKPQQQAQIGLNSLKISKPKDRSDSNLGSEADEEQKNQQNYAKYDRTKSIIFKSTNSHRLTQSRLDTNLIRVFFFNSPMMKMIAYNKKSTIRDLIQKSLDTYLSQNYDTFRPNQPIQNFQMRLPIHQNDFSPDMSITPIHSQRLLSENLFDTLVLVQKQKKQDSFQTKPTRQYSLADSSLSHSGSLRSETGPSQMVRITLMDQTYFELMRIQMQKQGNLEKLFRIIRQNGLNNLKEFVIKDDPQSEFELTPDHQVKLVQKNRLYLMSKVYMDQAEDDMYLGPIRLKLFATQAKVNYLPPIGINEASRYQQFEVTKINSFGIAIDRVLGIDQIKIYNYEKQVRQNKRQVTLVDKFLGFNNLSGTKKPFRVIKDIKQVKKFQGGVEVIFTDKITTYLIKNQADRQQIIGTPIVVEMLRIRVQQIIKLRKINPF